jgi:hypothetical protein
MNYPAKVRKNLKRGRRSLRQLNVAIMAGSVPLEDIETGKVSKECRYFQHEGIKELRS